MGRRKPIRLREPRIPLTEEYLYRDGDDPKQQQFEDHPVDATSTDRRAAVRYLLVGLRRNITTSAVGGRDDRLNPPFRLRPHEKGGKLASITLS
jgi:hypothetical protein